MSAVREQLPEGRYGRSADDRADRKLKAVGSVLGVLLLGTIGWIGYDYVSGKSAFGGELIKFKVTSAQSVDVHVEIRKSADVSGTCTLRALAESGAEVGRKDIAFEQREDVVNEVVTLRTTERATAAELVFCDAR
ncbi:DUF4307 domain-containing protein [Streptomyces sp. B-S-A8]|uniref:DUF4307 domain-containing protein n=1 Tax=Streptomyces solicavernae TaxID=3043614 RepID=A0ABT6RY83_9ACTN|nr:DUF4307 domain-containing protein [Streptomyces sp. B-S-A8]MDI3389368.1 DUF4307 domain-containing protein [Streptomyces sp. B-S-A8]